MTDFERIFRKRYKLLFAIALLVVAFSIVFGRMKPSRYSAASTVKVDRSNVTGFGMEAIIWGDYGSLETQTRVISSFPVLVRAAKRMADPPDDHALFDGTGGGRRTGGRRTSTSASARRQQTGGVREGLRATESWRGSRDLDNFDPDHPVVKQISMPAIGRAAYCE